MSKKKGITTNIANIANIAKIAKIAKKCTRLSDVGFAAKVSFF